MVKRTRDKCVQKWGCNNAKEGHGRDLVQASLAASGRLVFRKTAEGARADFCVYVPGRQDFAIGCQLKTTQSVQQSEGRQGYAFTKTAGYDGLVMVFIASIDGVDRVWLRTGASITSSGIKIPVHPGKYAGAYQWAHNEVPLSRLAEALLPFFRAETVNVQHADVHVRPPPGTRLQEYEAHLLLERQLPLHYQEPAVEHLHFDYTVEGQRWQMKVASVDLGKLNRFYVRLCKAAGRSSSKPGGRPATHQYGSGDFDWLAVLLPQLIKLSSSDVPHRGLRSG